MNGAIEAEPDLASLAGAPAMCWRPETDVIFQPFQLRENTDYLIDVTIPVGLAEARLAAEASAAWPFAERLATIVRRDPVRRWRATGTTTTITGTLRLRSHAGVIDLSTEFGSELRAEVVCQKIGYLDEFRTLLSEIADEMTELLLQYDSPVSSTFGLSENEARSSAALMFQLRSIMREESLPAAIYDLLRNFSSKLVELRSVEQILDVTDMDIDSMVDGLETSSLVMGGPLQRIFRGFSPTAVPAVSRHPTSDTPENRYVMYFLDEVHQLVLGLHESLVRNGNHISAKEVALWLVTLEDLRGRPEWNGVGKFTQFPSNSQLMQKRHGYRDILRFDLSLRLSMQLSWERGDALSDGLDGDIRPVHELYEYWCYLLLRRALARVCNEQAFDKQGPVDISADGLHVKIAKGRRSRSSFHYVDKSGRVAKVSLFYNRKFVRPRRSNAGWFGSYTAHFNPDYSIEIVADTASGSRRHWLHFDAKYRMERFVITEERDAISVTDDGVEVASTEYDIEMRTLRKRDDLFKMHTYRDGILGSRGAYVLFPGTDSGADYDREAEVFVRHPNAFGDAEPTYSVPSVGAFELCPGGPPAQLARLQRFLVEALELICSDRPYIEEEGFFEVNRPPPSGSYNA